MKLSKDQIEILKLRLILQEMSWDIFKMNMWLKERNFIDINSTILKYKDIKPVENIKTLNDLKRLLYTDEETAIYYSQALEEFHDGDCTKKCYSCTRCEVEDLMEDYLK